MKEQKKKINMVMQGVVTSTKGDKTVAVVVERTVQHPVYKKIVRKKKKFLAHDEKNLCKLGDVVNIKQVRPISKCKNWIVSEIISSMPVKEAEQ